MSPHQAPAWADGGEQEARLLAVADRVVAQAQPGEQVEVMVGCSQHVAVKAYGGEIESVSAAETASIGVRVVVDGRQGLARGGSLADDVVAAALADARENLAFAQPDPWVRLAEPDGVAPAVLPRWAPERAGVTAAQRAGWALELERAALAADPRVMGVRTAAVRDGARAWALASTTGIRVSSSSTTGSAAVTALAREGEDTEVGTGSAVARHPGALDLANVAAEAADRATVLLGARPVPTRRCAVVLDPRVTVSVLGLAAGMLAGDRVLKGRTPFADRLGSAVAAPALTLVDDGTNLDSTAAAPYDDEGLATRCTTLVQGGVLAHFLHNTYTARRAAEVSTASALRGFGSAPGVGALALAPVPGRSDPDELLAEVGDGLLVLGVSGLHSGVNPVSGDFSVGAEGVRISGGERAAPVRGVTLASTIPRLLLDIVAVGSDLTWLPGGDAGASLLLADVTLSGR